MGSHPIRWFVSNRYVHMRSFLGPSMEEDAVPDRLRERLRPRLDSAIRLAKIRIGLFVMIYAAVIGTVGAAMVEYLARVFGGQLFALAGEVFAIVVALAAFLALIGLVGLVLVNRALGIIEVEIYVLGMEVVSRCVAKEDARVPSGQFVRRKYT